MKVSLKESWKLFLRTFFDPIFLIALCITVYLTHSAYNTTDNEVKLYLSMIAMITAGILGAKLLSFWEISKLVEKGESAIRGLTHMANELTRMEKRIHIFLNEKGDIEQITKAHYEELFDNIKSQNAQTISAIENWADVIPDADVISKVSELYVIKEKIYGYQNEILELKKALDAATEENEQDKNKIEKLEKEIHSAHKKLEKNKIKASNALPDLLRGLDVSSSTLATAAESFSLYGFICSGCGNKYISNVPHPYNSNKNLCPNCLSRQ